MISYYELLGMIKKGNNPERVKCEGVIFLWNNGSYLGENSYITEYLLEKEMVEKNIEIIEDKKPKNLKIENNNVVGKWEDGTYYCYTLSAPQMVLANKINEIIEVINEEKEIQDNQE